METKFKFNSAICTSRFQSERLLALGLKKETADCGLVYKTHESDGSEIEPEYLGMTNELWENDVRQTVLFSKQKQIPVWSLHRLLEMKLNSTDTRFEVRFNQLDIKDAYELLLAHIEWLIKEGYFNKEYLNA